jgi:hypothetical protein
LWAGVGCGSDEVVVDRRDRVGLGSGSPTTELVDRGGLFELRAIVPSSDGGAPTVYEGIVSADGTVTVPGVPAGVEYELEIRTQSTAAMTSGDPPFVLRFPVRERRIELGAEGWYRANVAPATMPVSIALTAPTAAPFAVDTDSLTVVSLSAYMYRAMAFIDPDDAAQMNVPADGATEASGWTFALDDLLDIYGSGRVPLLSAAASDDLWIFQNRSEPRSASEDRFDPWSSFSVQRVVAAASPTGVTFVDGQTTPVTTELVAPSTQPYMLSFRGSSFASLRTEQELPPLTQSFVSISGVREAGDGPGYFSSIAPEMWSVFVESAAQPANPTCFPNESFECDPERCPAGCDDTIGSYRDPGDQEIEVSSPQLLTESTREILSWSVTHAVPWTNPANGQRRSLTAAASVYRPAAGASGTPIALELGAPRNILVNGARMPFDTTTPGVGGTPTITWEPPSLGTPEYYEVQVVEPEPPQMGETRRPRRTSARVFTRGTSATIPDGVLYPDRTYHVRVIAHRDGRDFHRFGAFASDEAFSTSGLTGVFSP